MARCNIAILGAGRQAYVHANAIVSVGAPAVLYSIYDLYPAAAEKVSKCHAHHPKVARSVEEILEDDQVDAVVIVTPNSTHAELVYKSAKAGKATLCEKPLDTSLEKIEKLRDDLKELEKSQILPYIAIGFPKRHDPSFNAMRAQLREKIIGKLEHLHFTMRDEMPQPAVYMATSGGMINDTCVHDFDLARALLDPKDEPVSIVAYGSTVIDDAVCKEAGDVMRVCITMATRQGVLLSITNARRCVTGNDQRVEAHCAFGDLIATNHPRQDVNLLVATAESGGSPSPWKQATAERYSEAFVAQMKELKAAVLGGPAFLASGSQMGSSVDDGWWASKAVAAARLSLKEGKVVLM